MLINRDHRGWLSFSAVFTVVSTIAYVLHAARTPHGVSGGSVFGLTFGVLGTSFMVVDALLAVRKKFRIRRIGSAQLWLKMHIWFGILAVVCIWFHSGFRFGGLLTTSIMVLFYVVIVGGILGLLLQQFLPSLISRRVPFETVGGQLDYVLEGLAADAYEVVSSVAGKIPEAREEQLYLEREEVEAKRRPGDWKQRARKRPAESLVAEAEPLLAFYRDEVRPFLHGKRRQGEALDFRDVVLASPEDWQPRIESLAAICEEARQLRIQRRLQNVLHGWLFVHAPLSFTLFVLVGIHIVFALRY